MAKQRAEARLGESQNMRFPPIVCVGMTIHAHTSKSYAESTLFAQTRSAELARELEIVKMEHVARPSDSPLHTSLMTSLIQVLAHLRVWERFKKRGGDSGPHKPPHRPSPPPSTTSRVRRRELEDA